MKLIHKYDPTTKLFTEDAFIDDDDAMPSDATELRPVGLHAPKWNGTKWIEGDKPAAAALKVEIKKHDDDEKAKKKDHDDAKTDNDDTAAGISRRVARLERILNLK